MMLNMERRRGGVHCPHQKYKNIEIYGDVCSWVTLYWPNAVWHLVQDSSDRVEGRHHPHSGVAPGHPHCVSRLRRILVCLGLHPRQLGQAHWKVGGFSLSFIPLCTSSTFWWEGETLCVFMAAGSRSAPLPSRRSSTLLPHSSPLSRTWNKYVCIHHMLQLVLFIYVFYFFFSRNVNLPNVDWSQLDWIE